MPSYHSYELPGNQSVLIEVSDDQPGGGMAVGVDEVIRNAGQTLAQSLGVVPLILDEIKNNIFDRLSAASEITVEFGAKLGGEVGMIVSKSQAEANFKVSVTWKAPHS